VTPSSSTHTTVSLLTNARERVAPRPIASARRRADLVGQRRVQRAAREPLMLRAHRRPRFSDSAVDTTTAEAREQERARSSAAR